MVEGDSGAVESLLDVVGDAIGVSVGVEGGEGPTVAEVDQGGADVTGDGVGIAPTWHCAVLYVPPHRRLRPHVLLLCSSNSFSSSTSHLSLSLGLSVWLLGLLDWRKSGV